jgi:hypothetical protein
MSKKNSGTFKIGVVGAVIALVGSFMPLFAIGIKAVPGGGGMNQLASIYGGIALNISAGQIGGFAYLLPVSALCATIVAIIRLQKGAFDNDKWYLVAACIVGLGTPIVIAIKGKNAVSGLGNMAQIFGGGGTETAGYIEKMKEMISVTPALGLFLIIAGFTVVLFSAFSGDSAPSRPPITIEVGHPI